MLTMIKETIAVFLSVSWIAVAGVQPQIERNQDLDKTIEILKGIKMAIPKLPLYDIDQPGSNFIAGGPAANMEPQSKRVDATTSVYSRFSLRMAYTALETQIHKKTKAAMTEANIPDTLKLTIEIVLNELRKINALPAGSGDTNFWQTQNTQLSQIFIEAEALADRQLQALTKERDSNKKIIDDYKLKIDPNTVRKTEEKLASLRTELEVQLKFNDDTMKATRQSADSETKRIKSEIDEAQRVRNEKIAAYNLEVSEALKAKSEKIASFKNEEAEASKRRDQVLLKAQSDESQRLATFKAETDAAIKTAKEEQKQVLQALKSEQDKATQEKNTVLAANKAELQKSDSEYKTQLTQIRKDCESLLANVRPNQEKAIKDMQATHEKALKDLQAAHEKTLEQARIEQVKKLTQLQAEIESLVKVKEDALKSIETEKKRLAKEYDDAHAKTKAEREKEFQTLVSQGWEQTKLTKAAVQDMETAKANEAKSIASMKACQETESKTKNACRQANAELRRLFLEALEPKIVNKNSDCEVLVNITKSGSSSAEYMIAANIKRYLEGVIHTLQLSTLGSGLEPRVEMNGAIVAFGTESRGALRSPRYKIEIRFAVKVLTLGGSFGFKNFTVPFIFDQNYNLDAAKSAKDLDALVAGMTKLMERQSEDAEDQYDIIEDAKKEARDNFKEQQKVDPDADLADDNDGT